MILQHLDISSQCEGRIGRRRRSEEIDYNRHNLIICGPSCKPPAGIDDPSISSLGAKQVKLASKRTIPPD